MDNGFHHEQTSSSVLVPHSISFQTSAMDSTTEMLMMGDYHYPRMNSTAGMMMFSGNSGILNTNSGYTKAGKSCASVLSDPGPGLKHDGGLAVEWSIEEQHKLEEGISKYADEPTIMKYIKIAAILRDKTVRDVALRCRWIMRKRRKQDELKFGKKLKDKKAESSPMASMSTISAVKVAPFSLTVNNRFQSGGMCFDALSISTRRLLEQNKQVLGQISANFSALKLKDNVGLFNHAKNNIAAILNGMRYIPGLPLPVSLNEDLANMILTATSQAMAFDSSSGLHLKQEPDY